MALMQRQWRMRFFRALAAGTTVVLLHATPVAALLYHFVDRAGVIHFTNVPNDPRFQPYNFSPGWGRFRASGETTGRGSLDLYIKNAAGKYNLDAGLIKAIIKVESNFDPRAVSPKGAQGLMQLMPATIKMLHVTDPFDPAENIHAGSRYLRMLLDTFHDQLALSLAAYNAGPALVQSKGGIPEIKETKNYVEKVLATYRDYRE